MPQGVLSGGAPAGSGAGAAAVSSALAVPGATASAFSLLDPAGVLPASDSESIFAHPSAVALHDAAWLAL